MRYLALISGLFILLGSKAQDMHYSQFWMPQNMMNPAMAGEYDGDVRVNAMYRNQWREIGPALNTFSFEGDLKKRIDVRNELDFGLFILRDEFSGFGMNVNKVFGNIAYTRNVKGHNLRFGLQVGYVSKAHDLSKQTFPVQWDYGRGDFVTDIYNNEDLLGQQLNFIDLNIGVSWSKKMNKIFPKVGFAVAHVNMPHDSYFAPNGIENLKMRFTTHAELEWFVNPSWTIEPKIYWGVTTNANNLVGGLNARYKLSDLKFQNIYAGIFYRSGIERNRDAIIPNIGFTIYDVQVGFAYDINVSSLSDVNGLKSSFEIGITYILESSIPKNLSIPCERY